MYCPNLIYRVGKEEMKGSKIPEYVWEEIPAGEFICAKTGQFCGVADSGDYLECQSLEAVDGSCPHCAEDYSLERDESGKLIHGRMMKLPGGQYVCNEGHGFIDERKVACDWEEVGEKLMREVLAGEKERTEQTHRIWELEKELEIMQGDVKTLEQMLKEKDGEIEKLAGHVKILEGDVEEGCKAIREAASLRRQLARAHEDLAKAHERIEVAEALHEEPDDVSRKARLYDVLLDEAKSMALENRRLQEELEELQAALARVFRNGGELRGLLDGKGKAGKRLMDPNWRNGRGRFTKKDGE